MVGMRGNWMLSPQALHLTDTSLGGISFWLILYFFPQLWHVNLTKFFSTVGRVSAFGDGLANEPANESFFSECTGVLLTARLSGTGRPQDLHFMILAVGGIVF